MRITEKRAELLRKYVLCVLCNDEDAYYSSLYTGIPDGYSLEEVYKEISYGNMTMT